MDISASQYSSASESGWTHYLDQSSFSESYFQRRGGIGECEEGKGATMEESEEDLSMVSDASSGPPHYDNECHYGNWQYPYSSSTTKESQKKKKVKEYGRIQQPSLLDDTASSPDFSWPNESQKKQDNFSGNGGVESELDFSQCVSATRTKQRKTKFQKHFSFGKLSSQEPGGIDGGKGK